MKFTSKSSEFRQWASEKEANIPSNIDDLKVKIHDINHASIEEIGNIKDKINKFNCCIYKSQAGLINQANLISFAQSIGMKTYDSNNIDNSPVSCIMPLKSKGKINYIPYTNKQLNWHTDGYYDEKPIFSWLLHCEEPASFGGENYLLDHELAIREYILKHDNLDSLSRSDAFVIPGNAYAGRDSTKGYICDINNKYRRFHMKFSMRKEHMDLNEKSKIAIMRMKKIIKEDCKKYYLTYKLSKNEGIVTNNILHGRNSFEDGKVIRKLYRIRSYERI
tara:strand:- start:2282 stop:3112 length:831 start_codon:yes stop_codon:yes gene_type:complete